MAFEFLLVEDDPEIREIITDYFIAKSKGTFKIDSAESGKEGQQNVLRRTMI